jgi:hypothetical protein
MQGTTGSFGYPGMPMSGLQIPLQHNQVMWQPMQLMQMQQMQIMQIQQSMFKGVHAIPSVNGIPTQNKVPLIESSVNGLDPLWGGTHNDLKASLSDSDEGDRDQLYSSIQSENV